MEPAQLFPNANRRLSPVLSTFRAHGYFAADHELNRLELATDVRDRLLRVSEPFTREAIAIHEAFRGTKAALSSCSPRGENRGLDLRIVVAAGKATPSIEYLKAYSEHESGKAQPAARACIRKALRALELPQARSCDVHVTFSLLGGPIHALPIR